MWDRGAALGRVSDLRLRPGLCWPGHLLGTVLCLSAPSLHLKWGRCHFSPTHERARLRGARCRLHVTVRGKVHCASGCGGGGGGGGGDGAGGGGGFPVESRFKQDSQLIVLSFC